MVKSDKGKQKNDYFTNVMIVQTVVCFIVIGVLLFSAKSDGKFATAMKSEYAKLMAGDFSAEDAADAFKAVKEYAAVFAQQNEEKNVSTDSFPVQEESQSSYIGGGADIEFTSLDALEGVCFDKYTVDFSHVIPLADYEITSPFGYRTSPISGTAGIHTGIDLAADYGCVISSFADGTVVDSAYDDSYGYYVKIAHDDNFITIYAHCSALCVESGEKVKMGDKIALVGSTGDSTGNHLHFEIRKDNIRVDPKYVLFDNEDKY